MAFIINMLNEIISQGLQFFPALWRFCLAFRTRTVMGLIGVNGSRLTAYTRGTSSGGREGAAFQQMRLIS